MHSHLVTEPASAQHMRYRKYASFPPRDQQSVTPLRRNDTFFGTSTRTPAGRAIYLRQTAMNSYAERTRVHQLEQFATTRDCLYPTGSAWASSPLAREIVGRSSGRAGRRRRPGGPLATLPVKRLRTPAKPAGPSRKAIRGARLRGDEQRVTRGCVRSLCPRARRYRCYPMLVGLRYQPPTEEPAHAPACAAARVRFAAKEVGEGCASSRSYRKTALTW